MSPTNRKQFLHDVFRNAASKASPENQPHLAGDEELLLRWVEGDITQAEHAAIVKHMDECPPCREEIAAMMKAGALELADTEEVIAIVELPSPEPRRQLAWAVFALAASLMMAAWIFRPAPLDSNQLLAYARRDLAAGNTQAALKQVTDLLEQSLAPASEDQVKRFHKNLEIQIARKIDSEYALDQRGSLEDSVYLSSKDMERVPAADRYEEALADYPDDVPLLLNYGQFLLEQSDYTEARQQFEKVLDEDNRNPRARLGLGLVAFNASPNRTRSLTAERRDVEGALAQFEMVLEVTPESLAAHINAAMCLDELEDRTEESLKHWRRAAELTQNNKQRAWIESRIKILESPDADH